MFVYVTAALLSAFLATTLRLQSAEHVNPRNLITYVPLLPLLAISVLRDGVGRDTVGEWSTYPRVFALADSGYSYTEVQPNVAIEPLYYVLNRVVIELGGDLRLVVMIMSVVFLVFMYRFIIDHSENIPLSLVLLVASDLFLFSLSGIRQAAAAAIAFYAVKHIPTRKFGRFAALIIIAAGFHQSALILLPFYFVWKRRVSFNNVLALMLLGIALSAFPSVLRSLMGAFYGDRYFGSKWDYSNFNFIPAAIVAAIVIAAVPLQERLAEKKPIYQVLILVTTANFFLMAISSLLITPIRLYFLLIPAAFVLIPAIVGMTHTHSKAMRPLVGLAFVTLISAQLAYELAIGNDAYGVWDYQWIWSAGT